MKKKEESRYSVIEALIKSKLDEYDDLAEQLNAAIKKSIHSSEIDELIGKRNVVYADICSNRKKLKRLSSGMPELGSEIVDRSSQASEFD